MPTQKKAAAKKAPAKAAAPKSEPKEKAVSGSDAGAADLQALADRDLAQGYFGISDQDPNPTEAYTLKTGPDSPSAASHTPAAKAMKGA